MAAAILLLTILFFLVTSPPKENQQSENVINDITGINAVYTSKIHKPTTMTEIVDLMRNLVALFHRQELDPQRRFLSLIWDKYYVPK